jgi:hypothetical protein
MESNVADVVCGLLAIEHKKQILNSKNKKSQKKRLIRKLIAKRNDA